MWEEPAVKRPTSASGPELASALDSKEQQRSASSPAKQRPDEKDDSAKPPVRPAH